MLPVGHLGDQGFTGQCLDDRSDRFRPFWPYRLSAGQFQVCSSYVFRKVAVQRRSSLTESIYALVDFMWACPTDSTKDLACAGLCGSPVGCQEVAINLHASIQVPLVVHCSQSAFQTLVLFWR